MTSLDGLALRAVPLKVTYRAVHLDGQPGTDNAALAAPRAALTQHWRLRQVSAIHRMS